MKILFFHPFHCSSRVRDKLLRAFLNSGFFKIVFKWFGIRWQSNCFSKGFVRYALGVMDSILPCGTQFAHKSRGLSASQACHWLVPSASSLPPLSPSQPAAAPTVFIQHSANSKTISDFSESERNTGKWCFQRFHKIHKIGCLKPERTGAHTSLEVIVSGKAF